MLFKAVSKLCIKSQITFNRRGKIIRSLSVIPTLQHIVYFVFYLGLFYNVAIVYRAYGNLFPTNSEYNVKGYGFPFGNKSNILRYGRIEVINDIAVLPTDKVIALSDFTYGRRYVFGVFNGIDKEFPVIAIVK